MAKKNGNPIDMLAVIPFALIVFVLLILIWPVTLLMIISWLLVKLAIYSEQKEKKKTAKIIDITVEDNDEEEELYEVEEKSNDKEKILYDSFGRVMKDRYGNVLTNKSKYSEKEIDKYGLTPEEKAEVYQGNYDPWQFEEDDPEEGDYYYEDE